MADKEKRDKDEWDNPNVEDTIITKEMKKPKKDKSD